jgi:glycosyltransferase involved in cell wall biosynthesis
MRIGISTSVIQRGKTGVAQYLFALLRAFLARNDTHEFVLFVLQEDLPLFQFVGDRMRLEVVSESFRSPVKNILWHQTKLPRLAARHRLNVLHIPSYRRMVWSAPCPRVVTIHDLAPFHIANKYDWQRMLYGRVIARRLARRQDRIMAISENTARDIFRFFKLPRERVVVVHNGLEHERFFPIAGDAARQTAAREHRLESPFFLYVARLEHPAKNHVRLIAAFERFKTTTGSSWQLVFAGSDWHGSQEIHSAIQHSVYRADVRCLGFVPDAALPDLYRAATAFVYPSLYEGFGMPPAEAMACGTPVISSLSGSLREVVDHAACIVDPEDIESITAALTRVATEPQLRIHLATAGLEQAKKFDWKKTAAESLQVYERALAAA